mmetsp:Transcript_183072/g.580317  ORF Transcript_183072/g.580317 Transcript_183072/m.580317 type:complete len:319 (-) Transcript_183072:545-1501(-)
MRLVLVHIAPSSPTLGGEGQGRSTITCIISDGDQKCRLHAPPRAATHFCSHCCRCSSPLPLALQLGTLGSKRGRSTHARARFEGASRLTASLFCRPSPPASARRTAAGAEADAWAPPGRPPLRNSASTGAWEPPRSRWCAKRSAVRPRWSVAAAPHHHWPRAARRCAAARVRPHGVAGKPSGPASRTWDRRGRSRSRALPRNWQAPPVPRSAAATAVAPPARAPLSAAAPRPPAAPARPHGGPRGRRGGSARRGPSPRKSAARPRFRRRRRRRRKWPGCCCRPCPRPRQAPRTPGGGGRPEACAAARCAEASRANGLR